MGIEVWVQRRNLSQVFGLGRNDCDVAGQTYCLPTGRYHLWVCDQKVIVLDGVLLALGCWGTMGLGGTLWCLCIHTFEA